MSWNGLSLHSTLCWVHHSPNLMWPRLWPFQMTLSAKNSWAFWLAIRLPQMSLMSEQLKSVERVNYGLDISSNPLKIYLAHQLQHFAFSFSNLKPNFNNVLLEYSYSLKIPEYIPGLLYLNFQQKLLKYKNRLIPIVKHQVLVPEWLSGMTRNHVGFARAGSNPAEHE